MYQDDCQDRLRFRLNDDDGLLRFVEFEIVDPSICHGAEAALREYLLGRALVNVDLDYLRTLTCTGNGECLKGVIRDVRRFQSLFASGPEGQTKAGYRASRSAEGPGHAYASATERTS